MSPSKNKRTARSIWRQPHVEVPMRDNLRCEQLTNFVYPSGSSRNFEAEGAIPCIDTDFPNADFDDDDLVTPVIAPHIPHEQFGLVLVPNGTNAEHTKSDSVLNLALFSREESVLVDLLMTLKKLRAPMKSYSEVLKWAIRSQQAGFAFRDVPQTSRSAMLEKMQHRMNLQSLVPIQKELYLPYSKTTIKVIYFDAKAVFQSLLTCPELNVDDNYIFHDANNPQSNPFAKPLGDVLGDINTGSSYLKTYDQLVKNANDMLLACIIAIDKTTCDTGGSGRLTVEPIMISYGLMKHSIRKLPYAMRVLGFICTESTAHNQPGPPSAKAPLPGANYTPPLPHLAGVSDAAWHLNEYHLQIEFILRESGFLALQEEGLPWQLQYRGQLLDVVLRLYIPFIVGDTEGHDQLCGHYKSRTAGVKQLCRFCECPTMMSSNSKSRDYRKRTPAIMNRIIRKGTDRCLDDLKDMSQQYLKNAFDNVRFGLHNTRGVFGACPAEMLHLVLIGWFKTVVESFFKQAGKGSIAVKDYNALCVDISLQLKRHSDRDLPRVCFSKGFSTAANLPGHEYAGCLIVMLISFHTTRFFEIFGSRGPSHAKEKKFGNKDFILDWKSLITCLLEWHSWLKKTEIRRSSAKKSVMAVSWLMRHMQFVAPRLSGGMLNNTVKMHLVLHIGEDILNFGVPENVNSAYAESAHIPISKETTKNTQKRPKTFTLQMAHRYVENLAIHRGHGMIDTKRAHILHSSLNDSSGHRSKGKLYHIWNDSDGMTHCRWKSSCHKRKNPSESWVNVDNQVINSLATHCLPHLPSGVIPCQTEYTDTKGQLYRAHPKYQDAPWFDHAWIKWPKYTALFPARIKAFVDLSHIRIPTTVSFPESQQDLRINPGLHAVIQSYVIAPNTVLEPKNTMVNRNIIKHYHLSRLSRSRKPILYLIHVKFIVAPTVCISDIKSNFKSSPDFDTPPDWPFLFMCLRQKEWGDTWEDFIHEQYAQAHDTGKDGGESDDEAPATVVLEVVS